jgi:hypothetical protein
MNSKCEYGEGGCNTTQKLRIDLTKIDARSRMNKETGDNQWKAINEQRTFLLKLGIGVGILVAVIEIVFKYL